MFAELVQAISEQAIKAQRAKFMPVKLECEPSHRYGLPNATGDGIQVIDAEPAPRAHKAGSIDTITAFAMQHRETSEVWFSREGVTCFLNGSTRRDRLDFRLTFSRQLLQLNQLEKLSLSQRNTITMFRTVFADCFSTDIVSIFRKMKFVKNTDGQAAITHGKASIGRTIEQSITGESSIPENIVFTVPIFQQLHGGEFSQSINTAVEIDTEHEQFKFIPVGDEIEYAISSAEIEIATLLISKMNNAADEKPIPIYLGSV